jgi:hypothetical protein
VGSPLATGFAWLLPFSVLAAAGEPVRPEATSRILVTQRPRGAVAATPGGADLPAGTRIVLVDLASPKNGARVVTGAFAAAARPAISPDASRFLFVGRKRGGERLAVWEQDFASGSTRRVVACEGDCTRAIYAGSLATMDTPAPVAQIVYVGVPRDGSRPSLHAAAEDGSNARRISFDPFGASDPLFLGDGRLVFAGGATGAAEGDAALFTIHVDGTGILPFSAPTVPSARPEMPAETAGGEVVFVEPDAGDPLGGGSLAAVPRTRSRSERRVVVPSSRGVFHSPSGLADGTILAAFRAGRSSYAIVRFDPHDPARLEPVFDDPDRDDLDPVAVVPRMPPKGRSSAVKSGVPHGEVYCLDARRSMDPMDAKGPPVVAMNVYRPGDGSTHAGGVLLASVPVETDGSFYLRVPARTPLRFEAIDSKGDVVRSMRRFLWVMPNESRGCVGCHEDPDLAPPNRLALALEKPPRDVGLSAEKTP